LDNDSDTLCGEPVQNQASTIPAPDWTASSLVYTHLGKGFFSWRKLRLVFLCVDLQMKFEMCEQAKR
jgi:hypothetical protein